ncbi:unnamed protein product (macronuclear) [Paramecium tetraurelia]|uniref:3'-5' exonuclease domain-containing protein n=1 Tax=Paramecium tetraurelia TaxID=5888 RepID=A0EDQ2_PARTE|nr:uncharacterized protein GSPATT00025763001 [Paramecium tetraurelia]CAK93419.1 unnamed protein product [Paramecium tetraurelia]|eukprot:XP_001460816.1 hypothetical protein (macronuclear) [Paramecium tetraurelia strain d4-2]
MNKLLWRQFSKQVIRSKQLLVQRNNQQEIQDYFRQLKIQSAKQRKDFEDIALQLLSKEQDKCKAYFYFLEISNDVTLKTLLQEIFTKAFLELNDFGNKQLALQKWQLIPLDFIEKYMEGFDIKPADIQDAQVKILTLLQNKKPLQAMKLIMIFKDQLNMSIFIDKFIQLDAVQDFSKVCITCPNLLKDFLIKLTQSDKRHHQKFATELIRKYNLKKEDYPQLIKIQNRQAVDRTYFPKLDEPYERVEERLQGYPYMLCHVIDKLLENNKVNEAYSVAVRQGLNDQFNLNGVLVENPLLKFDGFGITEQICYQEDPSGFIQFSDFNIHEDQIQFIDSVEKLLLIKDLILNAQITGFDTEFCHYFDEFAIGGVAIMQISTENNVYIIDIFNLREKLELLQFLNNYFASNKIKIGHSVWNDFTVMAQNMNLDQTVEPKNIVDLTFLYNEVFPENKNNVSLANQVYQLFGKKLSKKECFSNWQRRPLRKCQLHYGAMDAYICIALYLKLNQLKQLDIVQLPQLQQQHQTQQKSKKIQQIQKGEHLRYDLQFQKIIDDKQKMKFLVDAMLKKLATFLRNLGIDAEYNEKNDHQTIEQQAIAEQRVIITRDKKLYEKPQLKAPCFLLSDNLNTEQQFEEILKELQFQIYENKILSRCVKCNFDHVIQISPKTAQQYLDFKNNDSFGQIQVFWQCEKCLQVYWEGNQFKNSIQRFTKVAKNQDDDKQ